MAEAVAHAKGSTQASVGEMFLDRVELTPDWEAFRRPTNPGWKSYTWGETGEIVESWAAGLLALGVEPEQRVAIASSTILDWIWADLAIMCAGAATTTVYPSTPTEDVAYILADSGSVVVFAEDKAQLDKILAVRDEIPSVHRVVLLTDFDAADGEFSISADELARLGNQLLAQDGDVVRRTVAAVKPESLATIIYTSGTTGRPKGVRLTQSNWVYEGDAMDSIGVLRSDDLEYLWLPLAHSFGKVLISGQIKVGFAAAVDGRVDKIVEHLGEVKPTFIAAVPRIFEKIYGGIQTMQEREGGVKLKIFRWAEGVAKQAGKQRREGKDVGGLLGLQYGLADKLVYSKIRDRMGGRVRYFVSGSAPLSREVGEWMDNVGLVILEGYGLTETSAFTFVSRPHNYRFGTVGEPAPGTEVKIADDGEILVKGPGVMEGYHNLPEQTAEVFTDGWFHTGDIGEVSRRAPQDHRPQERPDQDLRWKVRRTAEHRGQVQGGVPVREQHRGARRRTELRVGAGHPRRAVHHDVGPGERRLRLVRRHRVAPEDAPDGAGLHRRGQRSAASLGDGEEVRDPPGGPHHRVR